MKNKTVAANVFVDMDGTLAVWNSEKSIEEVARKGYFESLQPFDTMVQAVRMLLNQQIPVCILSSVFHDDHSVQEKNIWLDKYLPEIPYERRFYVPYGSSKTDYVNANGEKVILIDDFTKNLLEWKSFGEIGIKALNGINHTNGTWKGYFIDIHSYPEIIANTITGILSAENCM